MFKASFPAAKTQEEKAEAAWLKNNFDLSPNIEGGREEMRLAGLWVPTQLANYLAPSYNLRSASMNAQNPYFMLKCFLF